MDVVADGDGKGAGSGDYPPGNMRRALVFQAVVACIIAPLPLALGVKRLGLGDGKVKGRLTLDEARERPEGDVGNGEVRTDGAA